MDILVRLGEPFWRKAKTKQVQLALAEGATVADMLEALGKQIPALADALLDSDLPPTVFIDDQVVELDAPLPAGARPTLVWAMAGG